MHERLFLFPSGVCILMDSAQASMCDETALALCCALFKTQSINVAMI